MSSPGIHVTEEMVMRCPRPYMEGWHMYRVTIGVQGKFGGDGVEMHMWAPPHVMPEDIQELLKAHD